MTALAIWKTISGFLGKVPWQIYAAIALLAAFWWWGNHQYGQGVADTDAKWEAAAQKLAEQSEAAALAATAEKEIRDQQFEEGQADITEKVDETKTDDIAGGGVTSYFTELQRQKDRDSAEAAN